MTASKDSVSPGCYAPTEHRQSQVYGGGHLNVPALCVHAEQLQDVTNFLAREDIMSTILKLDVGLEDIPQLVICHRHSSFTIANRCPEREYFLLP